MSHSHRPAPTARRRAAAPGTAADEIQGGPRERDRESGLAGVQAVLTRAAELCACCLASFAITLLLLAVLLGLGFIGYKLLG